MKSIAGLLLVNAVTAALPPVAPTQWSATIDTTVSAGGQIKKGTSKAYISDTHQAWRYESTTTHSSTLTLFDYKDGREMELDSTGTKCVAWCPPSSTYFNTIRVGNGKNGTSKATFDGVDTWSWTDNLFIIAMDHKHLTFQSGDVPHQMVEEFTPFGKNIGNGTNIYHDDFEPNADDSKFTVSNLDSCPKADDCQSLEFKLTPNVKQLFLEIGMTGDVSV